MDLLLLLLLLVAAGIVELHALVVLTGARVSPGGLRLVVGAELRRLVLAIVGLELRSHGRCISWILLRLLPAVVPVSFLVLLSVARIAGGRGLGRISFSGGLLGSLSWASDRHLLVDLWERCLILWGGYGVVRFKIR